MEEHDKHLTVLFYKKLLLQVLYSTQPNISSPDTFQGQLVDTQGIWADPSKVKATQTISEVSRVLGMINQLGRSTPNLAENTRLHCNLLSTKNQWSWGIDNKKHSNTCKACMVSSKCVLNLFDPWRKTCVSADAFLELFWLNSNHQVSGGQLLTFWDLWLQQNNTDWKGRYGNHISRVAKPKGHSLFDKAPNLVQQLLNSY